MWGLAPPEKNWRRPERNARCAVRFPKSNTLKLQMEGANLSSTTDESRVQLMRLEYN